MPMRPMMGQPMAAGGMPQQQMPGMMTGQQMPGQQQPAMVPQQTPSNVQLDPFGAF